MLKTVLHVFLRDVQLYKSLCIFLRGVQLNKSLYIFLRYVNCHFPT